jgi:hypothetical protein
MTRQPENVIAWQASPLPPHSRHLLTSMQTETAASVQASPHRPLPGPLLLLSLPVPVLLLVSLPVPVLLWASLPGLPAPWASDRAQVPLPSSIDARNMREL